jgi:RNA polymerase sigma factor (sigma-70 family)
LEITEVLEFYCNNNMKELRKICYPLIRKIGGITGADDDDFYSIALETLSDSVFRYDDSQKCQFKTFLYGNIKRKFDTEIRDRNRAKRIPAKRVDRLDGYITEDGMELSETVSSNFDMHTELFGEEINDDRLQRYLNCLSKTQRKVAELLSMGYKPKEIQQLLEMSSITYSDCLKAIKSYEYIKILM